MKEHLDFWICLYEYRGMETEGRTHYEDKFICQAEDEAEALYKYHWWLHFRRSNNKPSWESLSDYRKETYASGGWGYQCYRLNDDKAIVNRSDSPSFNDMYRKKTSI